MAQNLRISTIRPSSKLAWHKHLLYGLTNWGLFSAGALNLAVGTWFALKGQVANAATSLTAGLVLLFAATIDRFESLKGLGVEAKTRQLDQKIEQADEALRRLKEVAELTSAVLLDLNSKIGRLSSTPTPREAYALAQKVKHITASLGSETSSIQQILEPWVRIFCHDLATAIASPLRAALSEKIEEFGRERAGIRQPMNPDDATLTRTIAATREINTYIEQRLRKISEFRVDDYPERFLQLFEDVPFVSDEVLASIQAKARQFAPAMLELRQNLQLASPEPWFLEIDEHRKRS
jgi:hypothetical protein